MAIFTTLTQLVCEALSDGDPGLPALPPPALDFASTLQTLQNVAASADEADFLEWPTAARSWATALDAVTTGLYGSLGGDAGGALWLRVLQSRAPRVAAILALAGAVQGAAGGQPYLDWQKVANLIRDPQSVINNNFWDSLLIGLTDDEQGRLITTLVALVILAPQAIYALATGNLRFRAPARGAAGDTGTLWHQFWTASRDWVSVTVPLPDPTKDAGQQRPAQPPYPSGAFDLCDLPAGLEPDLSCTLAFRARRYPAGGSKVTDFETWLYFGVDSDEFVMPLGSGWRLILRPGLTAGFGLDGSADKWHADFRSVSANAGEAVSSQTPWELALERELAPGEPDLLVGPPYDTRFVIGDMGLYLRLRPSEPVVEIMLSLKDVEVVLPNRFFRELGVTDFMMHEGIRITAGLQLGYQIPSTLLLNYSAGLETMLLFTDHQDDGTVDFHLLNVRMGFGIDGDADGLTGKVYTLIGIAFRIGPVRLIADGFGLELGFDVGFSGGGGVEVGWVWPTGMGLELDCPPVKGGGFVVYDPDHNRYGGLLNLHLSGVQLLAFGIYQTLENGDASLIAVIGNRFKPGVPLGLGFNLTGAGGLFGLNRRADADMLRERLTSGAVGNVLFPEDPMRQAPVVLGDLEALFPPTDGVHVVGPSLRVTWLGLVDFDLALVFEFAATTEAYGATGITKVIILGCQRFELEVAGIELVRVRTDGVGILDLVKDDLQADVTLFGSHILELLHLTGDGALRLAWNERPYALFTLGGFHPDFHPEQAVFPDLTRLAVHFEVDEGVYILLRNEFYFAATSNSLQLGSRIDAKIGAKGFIAHGWFGFDLLIQFHPFYFEARIDAGFRVKFHGITLGGISVRGMLFGPGPLGLEARLCFEILFFDICWKDRLEFGEEARDTVETVADLVQVLAAELEVAGNLRSAGGGDPLVLLGERPAADGEVPIFAPGGTLEWRQNRSPLDTLVERYQGQPLARPQAVRLVIGDAESSFGAPDAVDDWFGTGAFCELDASEALNRASFERLPCGHRFGRTGGLESGAPRAHAVTPLILRLPGEEDSLTSTYDADLPGTVSEAIIGRRAGIDDFRRSRPLISVREESWSHAGPTGVIAGLSQTDACQRAVYGGGVAVPDRDIIELGGI